MFSELIISSGLDQKRAIRGLTEEEIEAVENGQGVQLPARYKAFLRECGRSAGLLCYDIHFFYPAIKRLKGMLQELIDEENVDFKIPNDAFIFAGYQGSQFHYFICGNDDPPTFRVFDNGVVEPGASSFTEYFHAAIGEYHRTFSSEFGKKLLEDW
ncbi:hypothetical protein bcgnr5380_57900 [Bacillus cereus]